MATTAPHGKSEDIDAAYHLLKLYADPTASYPVSSGVYSSRQRGADVLAAGRAVPVAVPPDAVGAGTGGNHVAGVVAVGGGILRATERVGTAAVGVLRDVQREPARVDGEADADPRLAGAERGFRGVVSAGGVDGDADVGRRRVEEEREKSVGGGHMGRGTVPRLGARGAHGVVARGARYAGARKRRHGERVQTLDGDQDRGGVQHGAHVASEGGVPERGRNVRRRHAGRRCGSSWRRWPDARTLQTGPCRAALCWIICGISRTWRIRRRRTWLRCAAWRAGRR